MLTGQSAQLETISFSKEPDKELILQGFVVVQKSRVLTVLEPAAKFE